MKKLVLMIGLPLFALCSEDSTPTRRSIMSPANEYLKKNIIDLCGKTVRLAEGKLHSAVVFELNGIKDDVLDCKWSVITALRNQSIVISYESKALRTALFSDMCLDYIKISHRDHGSILVCGDRKNVVVRPEGANFTVHFNPTWGLEFTVSPFHLYITAASLPSSMGECQEGSFFCAFSGLCIWEGFLCDGVENCLEYDDEHFFFGSTCLMPMLALELIVCGFAMLFVTTIAFCALLRDILKDYKLGSVHMERDPLSKRDAMEEAVAARRREAGLEAAAGEERGPSAAPSFRFLGGTGTKTSSRAALSTGPAGDDIDQEIPRPNTGNRIQKRRFSMASSKTPTPRHEED